MPDLDPLSEIVSSRRTDGQADPNRAALKNPRVRQFLDKISVSEGADYNTLVGGRKIRDLSRHPNTVGLTTKAGPSTAFGRYQITGTTNRTKLRKYADLDYSPENQDVRAVELLRQTKALDALEQGDEQTAMRRAGREWASIPGSPLPGRKNTRAFQTQAAQDPLSQIVGSKPSQPQKGRVSSETEPTVVVQDGKGQVRIRQQTAEAMGLTFESSDEPLDPLSRIVASRKEGGQAPSPIFAPPRNAERQRPQRPVGQPMSEMATIQREMSAARKVFTDPGQSDQSQAIAARKFAEGANRLEEMSRPAGRLAGLDFSRAKAGAGPVVPDTSAATLHRIDDPEVRRLQRIQGQVEHERRRPNRPGLPGLPALDDRPDDAVATNDAVLYRAKVEREAEVEQAKAEERYQREKPEIDRLAKEYRQGLRGANLGGTKWLAETGAKGASGLTEKLAAVARTGLAKLPFDVPPEHVADTINVHAQAMHQAAVEEGADRNEASKWVQDIMGGFIASSPELLAMGVGVPAPIAFGAGEGLSAYGGKRPVAPAVAHGAITGAAFELGGHGTSVGQVARKAGTVGAATTGIELAAGHPLKEAAATGATNALLVGAPGLAGTVVRPMKLREKANAEVPRDIDSGGVSPVVPDGTRGAVALENQPSSASAVSEVVHHSAQQNRRARNTEHGNKGQFKAGKTMDPFALGTTRIPVEVTPEIAATASSPELVEAEGVQQTPSTPRKSLRERLEDLAREPVNSSVLAEPSLRLDKNLVNENQEPLSPRSEIKATPPGEVAFEADVLDKRVFEVPFKELEGRFTRAEQRASVEWALKNGETIPPEVLADYPELQASGKAASPTTPTVPDALVPETKSSGRENLIESTTEPVAQKEKLKSEPGVGQPAPTIPELPPIREGENQAVKAARERIQKLVKEEKNPSGPRSENREAAGPLSREEKPSAAPALNVIGYDARTKAISDTEGDIYATIRSTKKRNGQMVYEVKGYSKLAGKHRDLEGTFEARGEQAAIDAAREIAVREQAVKYPQQPRTSDVLTIPSRGVRAGSETKLSSMKEEVKPPSPASETESKKVSVEGKVSSAPGKIRKPPKRRVNTQTMSLAQAVRASGGIRYEKSDWNKGEIERISNKETGTSGLVNDRAGRSVEDMAMSMAERGYRGDWVETYINDVGAEGYNIDGNKFAQAVEADFAGTRKSWSHERDYDFEAEYAKHVESPAVREMEAKWEAFQADGNSRELYKRLEYDGTEALTPAELSTLREKAKKHDIADEIEDAIESNYRLGDSAEPVGEVDTSFDFGERPAKADVLPQRSPGSPTQLGFVEEGLTQQSAPPPKETNQRERLIREENERQRARDPERAAAIDQLADLKKRGMTVDDFANQGSLLGETPTPERLQLLRELESGNKPAATTEPSLIANARERLATNEADKAAGIKQMRSGGPDTQLLIDHMIVHGWDAYQSGKAKFEDWAAEMKKRFGEDVEPHLRKVWATVTGKEAGDPLSSTAAKRAKVTEEREARGEEAIPRPERKADETLLADAKAANAKDPAEPIRLADEVLNKPRALSDTETVQLDLHKQELKNKYAELDKRIADSKDSAEIQELAGKSDALEREMQKIEEAWAASGTEKGRALRAQRIEVNQDFSLLAMVSRAKKARGKDLTTEERTTIKEQHAKIVELEAKLTQANERAVKAEAERAVIRVKRDVAKENRTAARGQRKQSYQNERVEMKALLAQVWNKNRGGGEGIHSALGLAKLDPEGEATKLVLKIAKSYLQENIGLRAEALVDEVHGFVKDAVDLSRRDVAEMISGYGKTYEMSKEKVDVRLRELKSIIASNLGKADVIEKGMAPARRGLQRDKPTQEMRTAARELRDALREHGIKIERSPRSVEEQQKSVMDAAKTNTRNRIEDLKAWITAGTRIVKGKSEIIPDAELTALRGERDRLTKIFDALDDPAADAKTIANKLRAANKSVDELQAQIRTGKVKATAQKPSGPTSPELEAARHEQKILREIVGKMRAEERKAGATPADPFEVEAKKLLAANKAFQTRTEKQIKDLEGRLAKGDFSDKPKREPTVYNRENLALQKQLEKVKADYANANYRAKRGTWGRIKDEAGKFGNLPKTMKSMADISAVFRQGGFYAITHPIEGLAKPSANMLRAFTETGYRNVENAIMNHPRFEQAKRDGVEFTGVDKSDPNLSHREEGYFGTEAIDTISRGKYNPLRAVKGVAHFSERTFVSFLDSQRMHIYDMMAKGMESQGITRGKSPESYKAIGKLINQGTGRGTLGAKGNQAAPLLNLAMFSPRLVASRVQLLNNMFNPVKMARMPKGARSQMIKDNVKFLAATSVAMGLATAAGGTVNWDTDDADFLKIRFGRTSYDTLTGLQQPMRYIINMARAATGGEDYPGKDMTDLTFGTKTGGGGFLPSKASPVAGAVLESIKGVDFEGRPRTKLERAVDLFSPLPAKDFWETMQKEGLVKGALKASPALTGIGVQTYDEVPEPKTKAEKLARKFKLENIPKKPRTAEQIDMGREIGDLKARARKGEDVADELSDLEGKISDKQAKEILKSAGMTGFQADFKRLSKKQALIVYKVADADKRVEVKDMLEHKMADISGLPDAEQADLVRRMKEIGMIPATGPKPREPQKAQEPRKAQTGPKQRYVFQ